MRADPTTDLSELAATAYVWGFPYVSAARLRIARTLPETPFASRLATSPGAALNNLGRQRTTSDPRYRAGVGANADTLYTSAWLDLSDEPFVLLTPRIRRRYYAFQVANSDTSSDHAFGSRTHGEQLPPVFLHGPAYEGEVPEGMLGVRSTTRYVNLPGRILVDQQNPADVTEVHRLQEQVRLRPLNRHFADADGPNPAPPQRPIRPAPGSTPALAFFHELGAVLRDEVIPEADRAWVESLTAIGLSPEWGFDEAMLPEPVADELVAGLFEGERRVEEKSLSLGVQAGGWTINYAGPRFGNDYLLRAGVAREQIYVTIPEEGLYPLGKTDSSGEPLHGCRSYRICFAPGGLPPVHGFWSVTLYSADGFLVPNDVGVYAIGDRTPGVRDADGSVTIEVGHTRPFDGHWLPAPDAPFYLMLRLFAPEEPVLDGRWLPPAIERVVR